MKVYKVNLTEGELRLFSEFLEQREFDGSENNLMKKIRKYPFLYNDVEDSKNNRISKLLEGDDFSDYVLEDDGFGKGIARLENLKSEWDGKNATEYLSKHPELNGTRDEEFLNHLIKKSESENTPEWEEERGKQWTDSLKAIRESKRNYRPAIDSWANSDFTKKYNPKTDKPLEEIKDVPIITEPEEEDKDGELMDKFRKDRKREEFVNKVKEIPGKVKNKFDSLYEKYEDISDGRSLGKDAAIIAGTTAALGAGAYGIHRYLKNKKKNKEGAEKKYKTSDKKKK